jgi:hypothetical protein
VERRRGRMLLASNQWTVISMPIFTKHASELKRIRHHG